MIVRRMLVRKVWQINFIYFENKRLMLVRCDAVLYSCPFKVCLEGSSDKAVIVLDFSDVEM